MGGNFHGWLLIRKKCESLTPQTLKHIWYVSRVWSVCSGFEAKTLHALMAFTTSPVVDVMEGASLVECSTSVHHVVCSRSVNGNDCYKLHYVGTWTLTALALKYI